MTTTVDVLGLSNALLKTVEEYYSNSFVAHTKNTFANHCTVDGVFDSKLLLGEGLLVILHSLILRVVVVILGLTI